MRNLILLSLVLSGMIFFGSERALAVDSSVLTITEGKTTAQTYAGNIVQSTDKFDANLWYVDPETKHRFLIKDGKGVSRFLKYFGQSIKHQDLSKILAENILENIDYEFTYQHRGLFLIDVEKNGEAWYINPLDNTRYFIANGQAGFETLEGLALDLGTKKLAYIPVTLELGFKLDKNQAKTTFNNYWTVWETLQSSYYQPEKATDQSLFYGSLKGMADSLGDPYTEFFSPQNTTDFYNRVQGVVYGIGAAVDSKDGQLYVTAPLPDTPAERAGLLPGDQVLKVDGVDIFGYSLVDATNLIKGPQNTKVVLQIFRPSTSATFELGIFRDKITIKAVSGKKLDNNIAYFKISSFTADLKSSFDLIKSEIIDNKTKSVIIDVRNNAGGYTFGAVDLADHWTARNAILLQEKYPDRIDVHRDLFKTRIDLPTVILVNGGTASASEIFTAALSENEKAQVVGTQTQGKGTGQMVMTLPDKSSLKYTVMEWLTPSGQSVQGVGITPDYIVANDSLEVDKQLDKAIKLLD